MPRSPDELTRGRDLTAEDFRGEARDIARDLVGSLLLNHAPDTLPVNRSADPTRDHNHDHTPDQSDASSGPVGGLIVETEAYINVVDPACHLTAGRTPRTESFYSGPGTVYVYTMHGHHVLNLISTLDDHPEGILIRAIEPTHGIDVMADRRGLDVEQSTLLASGPGCLTEAIGVTKAEFDDHLLSDTSLTISETDWTPGVKTTARIGVTSATDWPLRFVAQEDGNAATRDSKYVSKPAPLVDLDYEAVDRAYETLRRGDLPVVDDPHRP